VELTEAASTSTSPSAVAGAAATSVAWAAAADPWLIPNDRSRSASSIRSATIHGRTIVRRVMTIRPRGQAQTVPAHTAGRPRASLRRITHALYVKNRVHTYARYCIVVVYYLLACTYNIARAHTRVCVCVCVLCVCIIPTYNFPYIDIHKFQFSKYSLNSA